MKGKEQAIVGALRHGVTKEPPAVLLGDILQAVMTARDLGVRELAVLVGASPSRISRIVNEGEEAGSLRASTLDELAAAAAELGWVVITERLKLKARMRRRETERKGGWR